MIRFDVPPLDLSEFAAKVASADRARVSGRVTQVVGLVIESEGPNARLGDVLRVARSGGDVRVEVVGFRGDRTLSMPLGDLGGVRPGEEIIGTGKCLQVPFGRPLLGRVLDAFGDPMDGGAPLPALPVRPVFGPAPSAMDRARIERPMATGVRAIDGLLTLGEGQRMGIFAGSGVGKSTLLGMIARSCRADVNVICLVGERGRELREFIEDDLGPEGLRRSVVVCATGEAPALVRMKAALAATAIAEGFRDEGASVLLMMDSVTRFAMAAREVGLAVGEPPSSKGYTPSVFAMLPRLMERTGMGERGGITALYTVLVDGDDTNEPIADATRSILDGHIVLSRDLTSRGHYPPIDVMRSLSRTMPLVVPPEAVRAAAAVRASIADADEVRDLVSIGAYKAGSQPRSDAALARAPAIEAFLRQAKDAPTRFEETSDALLALTKSA